MKKFGKSLYAVALAALVLTACEKEPAAGPETFEGGDGMVTFSSNIRKAQPKNAGSRVDGDKWQNGDQIGVYMLKEGTPLDAPDAVFDGNANRRYQVRTVSAEDPTQGRINPYLISEAIYYPLVDPEHDFKFVAYHPYSAELDENFEFPVDVEDNKPVMYAETDEQEWFDYMQEGVTVQPVPLHFEHKMARLVLNIIPGDGFLFSELNDMTIDFLNANATGKFNLISKQFSEVEIGDVSFAINRDIENTTMTASLIIIPNEADQAGRSIVFTHSNSYKKKAETYQLIHEVQDDIHFEPGKEYTFNVTVTRSKVEFGDFTIDEWNPVNGENEMPGETETLGTRKLRLSASNPNSYVWDRSGILQIPAIKAYGMWIYGPHIGNYDENNRLLEYATREDADIQPVIIWADNQAIEDYVVVLSNKLGGYKATIDINYAGKEKEVTPMNMLVGLKVEGKILWSWHVWVVDPENSPVSDENIKGLDLDGELDGLPAEYDPTNNPASDPDSDEYDGTTYPKTKTVDVYFMDRNLGAKTAEIGQPQSMGLYYQWGRKDPFTGVDTWDNAQGYTKLYKVVDGEAVEITGNDFVEPATEGLFNGLMGQIDTQVDDLVDIVTNPGAFVTTATGGADSWTSVNGADQLWAAKKSPWDPCPEGWMVPAFIDKPSQVSPWHYYNKPNSVDPSDYMMADPAQDFASQYGWNFNLVDNAEPENPVNLYNLGYWPAAGFRAYNGTIQNFTSQGNYWSANNNANSISGLSFASGNINTNATFANAANALNIRCVKVTEE